MTSPLGFKARVGSALFAIFAEANVMYIPQDSPLVLHLPTSWQLARSRSLPHMHVQRWDLAQTRTCNRKNRRQTRYHCASDPAFGCHYCRILFMTPIVRNWLSVAFGLSKKYVGVNEPSKSESQMSLSYM